jgi:hypothetical protein
VSNARSGGFSLLELAEGVSIPKYKAFSSFANSAAVARAWRIRQFSRLH